MKKKLTLVLTVLMLIMGMAFTAQAATKKPVCPKKQTVYFNGHDKFLQSINNATSVIYIKNLKRSAKITDIKFTNSKINNSVGAFDGLQAAQGAIAKGVMLWKKSDTDVLEEGMKSKLTFTVQQDSRKYKLSCMVTFKEEPQAFKSVKVCGVELADKIWSSYHSYPSVEDFARKTGTIKVRMKSGLKLVSIKVKYMPKDYSKGITAKSVKNGGKITLKQDKNITETVIEIIYQYKKRPQYYSDLYIGKEYEGHFLMAGHSVSIVNRKAWL